MKKFMKYFSKSLAILLSVLTIISVMPMQTFAEELTNSITDEYVAENTEYNISEEVVEERTEYKKVYQLKDGTFYEITSNAPIHKYDGEHWIEPTSDNSKQIPTTTSDAIDYCAELSDAISSNSNKFDVSTFSLDITDNTEYPISYDVIGSSSNGYTRLTSSRLLVMKIPHNIASADNKMQVTTECNLFVDCQNPATGKLYAYSINNSWELNNSLFSNAIETEPDVIDFASITTSDIYSFDITDEYLKWEKGIKTNNGIAIKSLSSCKVTVGGCYYTRQYKLIDSYDSDFTYHTVDMGRAGKVYINDFTNTILLSRNEIGIDSNVLPIELYRYFDFGKAYATTNPSGEAARWNYDSKLTMITSLTYSWDTFDGSSIKFIPTDNIYNWIDSDYQGYTLKLDSQAINNQDFSNVTITTPENITYNFSKKGKVETITDQYNNTITIAYTSSNENNIDYIVDGLNRKYDFNYDIISYTTAQGDNISINTLTSIDIKNSDDTIVKINDSNVSIIYHYVILPNNHIALNQVDYPDDEHVYYNYDPITGYLKEIIDVDGRKLTFDYNAQIPIYSYDKQTNTLTTNFTNVDYYPSITSIKEEVVNIDDNPNDEDYQQFLLKSSLNIDRHNNYQRIFTNNLGETEKIQYNQRLKILYYQNSDGETFYADYSDNEDGNDSLTQIASPEIKDSLISNFDFETGIIAPFEEIDGNSLSISSGTLSGKGQKYLQLSGTTTDYRAAVQSVKIDGKKDDIFVVGGWAKANAAIPNPENFFGIEIYECEYNIEDEEYNATNNLLYRLAFDSTIDFESQFRLGAFQLNKDIEAVQFRFVFSAQSGTADFDEALLFKSSPEDVTFPTNLSEDTESTSVSNGLDSYTETLTNSIGLPTTEITSNGTSSVLSQYEYDNQYYLSSVTNHNNIKTNYSYNSQNGLLESMAIGNMKTEYSYTATGALAEVSKVNAALTTDSNKLTTEYSYSHDRITSVIHNGFQYTFTYNSFGNVKKIDIENISSLITYDYSKDYKQNLNSITYANGNILSYEYDENDNVKAIYFQNDSTQDRKCYYQYEYDENGNLVKITDNDSARVVEYSDNLYTISEIITDEDGNTQLNTIYSETVNSGVENAESSVSGTLFGVDFTYTEYEREYQSSGNNTKYSSKYTFTIDDSPINMESVSVSDYFGRVASTEFSVSPFYASSNTNTHTVYNTYTYKEYETSYEKDGETINVSPATTSLIETFETQVINKYVETDETGNPTTRNEKVSNIFTSSYKYDAAGRITHIIYSQGDANSVLASYYEYDEFGQLILEIDGLNRTLKKFTYDLAGNIIKKEIYDENAFSVDNSFNVTIDTTAKHKTIDFKYNEQSDSSQISFPDLLTSFDGQPISYDKNGNPLNYYTGTSNDEEYALTWEGTLLKSVRNEDMKIDYSYDSTGLRTKKTFYSLDNNGNQTLSQEIEYIWSDDVLVGYEIAIYEDGVPSRVVVKVLYDEYGSPIGVGYHMVNTDVITDESTTTVLSNDNILWFIKDGQGNVQAIYSELDDFALNCSYDSYGNLSVGLSGRFIDEINSVISAASSSNEKLMYAIAYAIACAVTTGITLEIGQNSYKGYLLDVETGLYYCQNRYYSPEWCRFISMDDPAQLTQNYEHPLNANLYAYCYNDPVNNIDPTGRSSYTLTGVGLQAEMSATFLSFAGEVGIELVYVWSKNALYAYYYYGGGAGYGYTNRAINYLKSSFKDMAISPKVSLKNIANLFKLNYSITIGFFGAFTNKNFSWPNSYTSGYSNSDCISIGKFKGYKATSSGCKVYGICYAPIGNSGFSVSSSVVKYKKISFDSSKIKTYLSSQKNNITKAID